MKQIILSTALLFATALVFAQAPEGFNYQAAIRNSDGEVLSNQQVSMRMTLLEANVSSVYQETHSVATNDFGLVNMVIGQGTVTQGVFSEIDWSAGNYFIQTAVDISGGSNYQVLGSQQLLSVPYSMYSKEAERLKTNGSTDRTFIYTDGL